MVNRRVLLESGVVTLAMTGIAVHTSSLSAQESVAAESADRESAEAESVAPGGTPSPAGERVQVDHPEIEVVSSGHGFDHSAPPENERSNRILSAAFLLLMGIVTLGVLLLATVLLLGSRARRVAREPLPETPPQDPDWFLRKKLEPPAGSHTAPPE